MLDPATPPPAAAAPNPPRIVLFDGVCAMCSGAVDLLIRLDRDRLFKYAALQGETAAALRKVHPEIPENIDTMAIVDDGVVYVRMKGVCRAARYLPWPWKAGYAFFVLPAWLTNPLYNLVAAWRYRLFGKKESCRLPTPEEVELILP